MTLEQIIYLVEIYRQKSFTKAARSLYISQSTISTAISNLEKELNLPLFKRTNTGAVATMHTEHLLNDFETILSALDQITQYAAVCSHNLDTTVNIAAAPSFCQCILIDVIGIILGKYPQIKISLAEKLNGQIIDDLYNGHIDFGIIGHFDEETDLLLETLAKKSLHYELLHHGQLRYYLKATHPLLKEQTITEAAIGHYPLITSDHLLKYLPQWQQKATIINNYHYIQKIISQHDAIAILPNIFEYGGGSFANSDIIPLPSQSPCRGAINYGWIRSLKNTILPAEEIIITLIKEQTQRLLTQQP